MKKIRKVWDWFWDKCNDLIEKLTPKGIKEWAVFIWMYITLLMFAVCGFYIEELYDSVLDLLMQ